MYISIGVLKKNWGDYVAEFRSFFYRRTSADGGIRSAGKKNYGIRLTC